MAGGCCEIVHSDADSFFIAPIALHSDPRCESFQSLTPEEYIERHYSSPRVAPPGPDDDIGAMLRNGPAKPLDSA